MLRLDLHLHSEYSPDSSADVKEMVRAAARRGVHGLCIADHNTLMGSTVAMEMTKESDLIVVRGMEVSSRDGHILAYGIWEEVPAGLSAEETVERITEQGGFAVAAHPYRFWSGLREEVIRTSRFQAVEVLNARSVRSNNDKAESLAQELGLPVTAGSDAHRVSDLGRALTLVPEGPLGEEDILVALQKGLGRAAGASRSPYGTLGYVAKCVGDWALRGFRKI